MELEIITKRGLCFPICEAIWRFRSGGHAMTATKTHFSCSPRTFRFITRMPILNRDMFSAHCGFFEFQLKPGPWAPAPQVAPGWMHIYICRKRSYCAGGPRNHSACLSRDHVFISQVRLRSTSVLNEAFMISRPLSAAATFQQPLAEPPSLRVSDLADGDAGLRGTSPETCMFKRKTRGRCQNRALQWNNINK